MVRQNKQLEYVNMGFSRNCDCFFLTNYGSNNLSYIKKNTYWSIMTITVTLTNSRCSVHLHFRLLTEILPLILHAIPQKISLDTFFVNNIQSFRGRASVKRSKVQPMTVFQGQQVAVKCGLTDHMFPLTWLRVTLAALWTARGLMVPGRFTASSALAPGSAATSPRSPLCSPEWRPTSTGSTL